MDVPSLGRGSKRSLSGLSPPYAAPLSPKHLRTEAHPSEGTAQFAGGFVFATVIPFLSDFLSQATEVSSLLKIL